MCPRTLPRNRPHVKSVVHMAPTTRPQIPDLPPTIIVHVVRHAHADFSSLGESCGLSLKGERQCDDLARTLSKYLPHVTNVICSPYNRCIDTARRATRSGARGLKIDLMRALSGREEKNKEWVEGISSFEDSKSDVGRWITRAGKTNDVDFVKNWLCLREMPLAEAQKIREIIVVTHEQFLEKLFDVEMDLDPDFDRWNRFSHAEVRTYSLDTTFGALVPLSKYGQIDLREEQEQWMTALEHRLMIADSAMKNQIQRADMLKRWAKPSTAIERALEISGTGPSSKIKAEKQPLISIPRAPEPSGTRPVLKRKVEELLSDSILRAPVYSGSRPNLRRKAEERLKRLNDEASRQEASRCVVQ